MCRCVLHSLAGWLLLQCCLLIRRQRCVDCCAYLVTEALLLTYYLPRLIRLLLRGWWYRLMLLHVLLLLRRVLLLLSTWRLPRQLADAGQRLVRIHHFQAVGDSPMRFTRGHPFCCSNHPCRIAFVETAREK